MRAVVSGLLDLVFPRNCVITGKAVDDGSRFRFIGEEGFKALHLIQDPCCFTCGFPFWGMLSGVQDCPHCRELNPEFRQGRSLFLADGAGRRLVHLLKYHQTTYLLEDIKRLLNMQTMQRLFLADSVFVPVPLYKRRLRERGYNQSVLLAGLFAESAGGSMLDCLKRVRDTGSQTVFNREERERNVRGAFACKPGVCLDATVRYVLVDDVFTTGNTLNACAVALQEAGADLIDVFTLAHG